MIKQVKSLNQEIVFRMAKTLILFHLVKFFSIFNVENANFKYSYSFILMNNYLNMNQLILKIH